MEEFLLTRTQMRSRVCWWTRKCSAVNKSGATEQTEVVERTKAAKDVPADFSDSVKDWRRLQTTWPISSAAVDRNSNVRFLWLPLFHNCVPVLMSLCMFWGCLCLSAGFTDKYVCVIEVRAFIRFSGLFISFWSEAARPARKVWKAAESRLSYFSSSSLSSGGYMRL